MVSLVDGYGALHIELVFVFFSGPLILASLIGIVTSSARLRLSPWMAYLEGSVSVTQNLRRKRFGLHFL
jgi:hypothetical protein